MTEIDEILTKLESDDRYSQSKCLKCEKGFENHEYHCFGPDLDGCMASQKELQITVNRWKKERNKASSIIRQLQSDLAAANTDCVRMRESKNRVETELDHTKATLTAMRLANASEFKRGHEVMIDAAMEIRQLQANIDAANARAKEQQAAFNLIASDAFFISGEGGYLKDANPKVTEATMIYAVYSHYASDLEEVPNYWLVYVNEAGLKFGYEVAAMGWVLFRRNEDKLIKIITTADHIAARDWFRVILHDLDISREAVASEF